MMYGMCMRTMSQLSLRQLMSVCVCGMQLKLIILRRKKQNNNREMRAAKY